MLEIDEKSCFSIKKKTYDFDQRTACGAPNRWSKYTTNIPYRFWYAAAWHQLDLNMKDQVKSTKNEISII